ncbi:MAG: hypothetical protein QM820_48400 [Minicystis sp.]
MMKNRIFFVLTCASLLSSLSACSSSGGGPDTNGGPTDTGTKGDTTSTGGGGTGGNGPTNSGDACSQCWPQCFLDMFAACTPTGACTQQNAGTDVNACYENGVKVSSGISPTGSSLTYYKADGTVCFTADSSFSATSATSTYKDADGNVLLKDTADVNTGAQTVECGGQTYMIDSGSDACKACAESTTGETCTNGTCTTP